MPRKTRNSQKRNLLPLNTMPAHLKIKIMEKVNSIPFTRMLRTNKKINEMVEKSKNHYQISVKDRSLILEENNKVYVMKGPVDWLSSSADLQQEYEMREEHWDSVRFFSFGRIQTKCNLELYDRFKAYLTGNSIGCIYDHLTTCPYDYVAMLRPSWLKVTNIDNDLYETVKNMDVAALLYTGGRDSELNTDLLPHLAANVLLESETNEYYTLDKACVKYIKAFMNDSYRGKMKHLAFLSRTAYNEVLPAEVKDQGLVWIGDIPKNPERPNGDSLVCGFFPNSDSNFALLSGFEGDGYSLRFEVNTAVEAYQALFMHGQDVSDYRPLVEFYVELMRGRD